MRRRLTHRAELLVQRVGLLRGVLETPVDLRVELRGALAFFLRHLLGALRALRSHGLLLLVHSLTLHRAVALHVARGLLAAAEQLVEPTHWRPPCGFVERSIRNGHRKRQIRTTFRPSGSDTTNLLTGWGVCQEPSETAASIARAVAKKARTPAPPRHVQAPQRRVA